MGLIPKDFFSFCGKIYVLCTKLMFVRNGAKECVKNPRVFLREKSARRPLFQSELCCAGTEDDLSCVSNLTSPLASALQGTRSKTKRIFLSATTNFQKINISCLQTISGFKKIVLFFLQFQTVIWITNFLNKKCPLFEE